MQRSFLLVFVAMCLVVVVVSVSNAPLVDAATDSIQTYSDPELSLPATVFPDGMPVYFTVSDGVTAGDTATATVTNGTETISMTIYDDGTYPDKVADDGIYTGHFRVTRIMTIDVPSRANQPKIVDCIHLEQGQTATIEVDLDGGGDAATKEVYLTMLFDVKAICVKDTSATITWTTSVPATSCVEYGLDATYGNVSALDTTNRLHHRVLIEGLTPGTTYHYRVLSKDIYGGVHISGDFTFTTLTAAEVEAAIKAARADGQLPKTYYVKPDGDDSNDGLTIATAWKHIAFAVQQLDVGDTLYVLPGTYQDEHIEFPKSGLDIAPIRLLAFSNMPVLDGLDRTGIAIRIRDKSYIEIGGLRIVNYETGIRGEGVVQHLYIHNFEMEDIEGDGLCFDGASVQNCRFTDFKMNEISLDSGTAVTHFDYSSTDTYNVEIANFTITNAHGEAINWRNSRWVHIHHGTIKDSGSDALHYQLNVHCSVASDLHIENTGWHGIAIHDHTVGDHPCYNNLIRNCYVYGAQHNDVDLHSGTFNTVVENCHLDGPPATGQGIYFHNLGAGLIARDNLIHDCGDGIDGGPSSGEFLTDIIVENNILYNCTGIHWQGGTQNVVVRGNIIYDSTTSECVHISGSNVLIEGNDISGKVYRISSGGGDILNALDKTYYVKSGYGAEIKIGHTDGKVFKVEPVSPPHITAPKWYPNGGYFNVFSDSSYPWPTPKVTTYPMTAVPAADEATITVSKFDSSLPVGEVIVEFTADTTDGNAITFTISDLIPNEDYEVFCDGNSFALLTATNNGSIQFSNSDWLTARTFTIKQVSTKTGTLTGTVTEKATGDPIEGATVTAGTRSAITGADGKYTIKGLLPGTYDVTVSASDYAPVSKSATITAGETTTVDFELEPGDTTPPVITIKRVRVVGTVSDPTVTEVEINGVKVPVSGGVYSYEVILVVTNTITVKATNAKGQTVTRTINVR